MTSKTKKNRIIDRIEAGFPSHQIVRIEKVSAAYVSVCRKAMGLPLLKRGPKFKSGGSREAYLKLRQDGLSFSEIAERFGVTRQAVQSCTGQRLSKLLTEPCSRCGAKHGLSENADGWKIYQINFWPEQIAIMCPKCLSQEKKKLKGSPRTRYVR